MILSHYPVVGLIILVSFLWGFWYRFVKKLGSWPLPAFMIHMYGAGLAVVIVGILLLQRRMVPEGIAHAIVQAPKGMCTLVMLCGAGFSVGMLIHLYVVSKMGLIYSTSVVSSFSIILGTILSSVLGGIPNDTTFLRIAFGAVILLAATLICQWAGRVRDKERKLSQSESQRNDRRYLVILAVYLLLFSQSYTIGMSVGLRTELNPDGLPGILAVGILAVGAFFAILLVCGVMLIRSRRLKSLFHPEKKICYLYAIVGGFCCLGGDFIHSIASPVVSVAIAWPLCSLSGLWHYMWGIVGGEFRQAGGKAKALLGAGMSLFVIGVMWLALARFVR